MITLEQFWMGRDKLYAAECTDEIRANAAETVRRWNLVLEAAAADGSFPGVDGITKNAVASGWRPASVNERTSNAAAHSTHMTGQACDIRDNQGRTLARWALLNQDFLAEVGMWMEDPRWCPSWVHLQSIQPRSGHRTFIPSSNPPLSAPLPEQR